MTKRASKPRRIVLFTRADGDIGYRVQAGNWATIEASEEGFKRKSYVLRRLEARYPGVEIVDRTYRRLSRPR